MRIALVTHKFVKGDGQGRVNYETARYLANNGHDVTLIAAEVDASLAALPNITSRPLPTPQWVRGALLRYPLFARRTQQVIAAAQPDFDIVHVNGCVTHYPGDVNACHFVHSDWIKSPYHPARVSPGATGAYQSLFTKLHARWERKSYRAARRVVAVSEAVRQSLITEAQVTPEKIAVIYPGLDTQEFRPRRPEETNALRAKLGLGSDAFLLFFTGGVKTNRKNLDMAIQSVHRLGGRFHLAVAGDYEGGPYPALVKKLNVMGRVHFLGHCDAVPALLRGADAFPFASHYDPSPASIIEAMASGVPVITAPSVGNSHIIQHGENGFVLQNSYDLESMTDILTRLAANPEYAATIGANARTTAAPLSWEAMAHRYEAIYEDILAQKRRPQQFAVIGTALG